MEPGAQVFVCNKATGSLLPGKVAAFNASGGRDYALIRLGTQPNVRPLTLKEQARRTDRISAWGFPGAVTGGDPKFAALLKGDVTAAPEVVYTEGTISVVLERTPPLIVHSAVISQGNSGGPLVDEDGAVLGVNSLIRLDDESYRQSSLAIAASDIIAFLREAGFPHAPAPVAPAPARLSGGKE
jgi:S1-C subfamily serine protease